MPASCCASLSSNVAIPVPLTCPNLCRASWIEMAILRRLFMVVVIIFLITYTKPIPLHSPFPFGRRIIVVQVSSAGTLPSQNISCDILTKSYYLFLSDFFFYLVSLSHIFKCSTCIPEVPPALPP